MSDSYELEFIRIEFPITGCQMTARPVTFHKFLGFFFLPLFKESVQTL